MGPCVRRDDVQYACVRRFEFQTAAFFTAATSRSRRLGARVLSGTSCPLNAEGVGNAGCPLHPQPRVQWVVKHTSIVATGPPVHPAFPHAMVLTASFVLLCPKNLPECANGRFSTNRPSLDLSPFVLKGCEPDGEPGTDPVSSSTRTVAWASSPDRARKGVDDGTKRSRCRRH